MVHDIAFSWINPLCRINCVTLKITLSYDPNCDDFLDFLNSVIVLNFTDEILPISAKYIS